MSRRRPVLPNAGAVARPHPVRPVLVATLAVLLVGCSPEQVTIESPGLDDQERRRCPALVEALPDQLVDQPRREPSVNYGAAWGDPAIVLRCGVDEPAGFDELSACQIVNDVAWFVPESQITGEAVDVTMTTVGRSPGVEVTLPAAYFPPAAAMAQLSDAVRAHTDEVEPCG
jgi:hypothetical protein